MQASLGERGLHADEEAAVGGLVPRGVGAGGGCWQRHQHMVTCMMIIMMIAAISVVSMSGDGDDGDNRRN